LLRLSLLSTLLLLAGVVVGVTQQVEAALVVIEQALILLFRLQQI